MYKLIKRPFVGAERWLLKYKKVFPENMNINVNFKKIKYHTDED